MAIRFNPDSRLYICSKRDIESHGIEIKKIPGSYFGSYVDTDGSRRVGYVIPEISTREVLNEFKYIPDSYRRFYNDFQTSLVDLESIHGVTPMGGRHLYDYQLLDVARIYGRSIGNFNEPGLGKTAEALYVFWMMLQKGLVQ